MRPPQASESMMARPLSSSAGMRSENGSGVMWCMRQWFGGVWKGLFFLAAVAVMTAGILGVIGGIQSFLSPFSMCNQIFLCIFGSTMLIIDFPADFANLQEMKFSVWRYLLFMTRFTGRGIWYLYLSTMIWCSLYNLDLDPFIGFLLSCFCGALGFLSIFYGLQKSLKLERARQSVVALGADNMLKLCPKRGLTLPEFNDVIKRVAGFDFSAEELEYIAAAISHSVRSDDVISEDEWRSWTSGKMTIM